MAFIKPEYDDDSNMEIKEEPFDSNVDEEKYEPNDQNLCEDNSTNGDYEDLPSTSRANDKRSTKRPAQEETPSSGKRVIKVTTNKTQYQRLFELLQEKPEIAQGFSKTPKDEVKAFWEKLQVELNSLGPPTKDTSSWRKVWLDWKAYIKRKLVENKTECRDTFGGTNKSHKFSNLEEGVIELVGLQTLTNGIKVSQFFGIKQSSNVVASNLSIDEDQTLDMSMTSDIVDPLSAPKRYKKTTKQLNESTILLKKQIKLQQEFYNESQDFYRKQNKTNEAMSSSLRQISRSIDKMCEIEEQRLEEIKRHNNVKEAMLRRKIEMKMKILEIKKAKYKNF